MTKGSKKLLKAYFVKSDKDESDGIAVIAESWKEARMIGYKWFCADLFGVEFIEVTCKMMKGIDTTGFKKGAIHDFKEGLRRGLYTYIESECDMCHKDTRLTNVVVGTGQCICDDCDEKRD